jgi:hypothetical protein
VVSAELDAATGAAPREVTGRDDQFNDALDRDRGDQQYVPGHE